MIQRFPNNLNRVLPGVGKYDIPEIQPETYRPLPWIDFRYVATSRKKERTNVHFFLADSLFERVWTKLNHHVAQLAACGGVLSPDFSLFTDWPVAAQIWNHYRKHYVAAILQEAGATVYPTISWSDEQSYKWCFDGEPVKATVAVSSVGTQYYDNTKRLFMKGYDAMLERLQPETILFYGNVPDGCRGNIVPIEYSQKQFRGTDRCGE